MTPVMSAYGITDYTTYVLAVLVAIVLPGPNSIYCLWAATTQSKMHGWLVLTAVVLGDTLLMLAAVLGLSVLLQSHAAWFSAFKWLGGAYLLYMGWGLLRQIGTHSQTGTTFLAKPLLSHRQVFTKGLLLSLSNPKAIVFFAAFFVLFIDPAYPHPALGFLILGVTLQAVSIGYLSVLIYAGSRLRHWVGGVPWLGSLGKGAAGMLFVGFALSLWRS